MFAFIRYWWVFVLRGILLILFGIAALIWPGITLVILALWIGAALFVEGIFALATAVADRGVGGRGWLALEGLLGVVAGIVTFFYPGVTKLVLLVVVAVWAIITGLLQLTAAIRLRHVIRREWMLGLAGVLAILFGALLLARPLAGLLTLTLLLGWFLIVYGAALIGVGVRLRRLHRDVATDIGAFSTSW